MDAKQLVRDIFEMIDSEDYGRVSELIHEDYVATVARRVTCTVPRAFWKASSRSRVPSQRATVRSIC
jgi:hypothetical protein